MKESKMILPTAENILMVIRAIEALNKAKQAYWKAYAATGKYGGLDDSSKQKLWLSYVKPALDIVMDHFRDFQLYGYIQLYGTGNLKSVEAINLLVDGKGVDSAESDDTATDELIKELETVRQRLISQKRNPPANTDGSEKNKSPKVFISYSHDSPEHKKWVLDLAINLRENGIDVILDQWDLKLGGDVAKFMGSSTDADRVLMICTEPYVKKADEGKGGVGYEAMIVTGELIRNLDTTKFIPVIRQNPGEIKLPKSVSTRAYINLSNNQSLEQEFERLLRDLHQAPAVSKPPIGENPFITQSSSTDDGENEQSQKGQAKTRSVSFRKNSPLYSVTKQKIAKLRETLKRENLTPWFWFNSRGVRSIPRFDGGTINIGVCTYGSSQAMVFWESIKPFLQDAIVKTLDGTLETCRIRGLKPEEPYMRETTMLLDGHLIDPIYRYMAEIDQRIRGNGNPKSVKRRDVTDEITEMVKFLDKCKDEIIQGLNEQNEFSSKTGGGEGQKKQMWFISFIKSVYHITVKAITEAMMGK
jgi:hypothetical protein